MDLDAIANLTLSVAGMVVVPVATLVAHRLVGLAQKKLHLQVSIETQRQIDAAVTAGAGVIRAKLANGHVTLPDLAVGNPHIDQAAGYALDIAGTAAMSAGVTKDDVAKAIIGAVGHALGDDPSVPSVAAVSAPVVTPPARIDAAPPPLPALAAPTRIVS